jgi:hypothetical protein
MPPAPGEDSRTLFITFTQVGKGPASFQFGAKALVSSLYRTLYSGRIAVFHPQPAPLFHQKREICDEFHMPQLGDLSLKLSEPISALWECVTSSGLRLNDYDSIVLCSPTALALRNVDHLFTEAMAGAMWRKEHFIIASPPNRLSEIVAEAMEVSAKTRGQEAVCACGAPFEYREVLMDAVLPPAQANPAIQFSPYSDATATNRWLVGRFLEAFEYKCLESIAINSIF